MFGQQYTIKHVGLHACMHVYIYGEHMHNRNHALIDIYTKMNKAFSVQTKQCGR